MASRTFQLLLEEIRQCTTCAEFLPLGPLPVIQAHPKARVLIAGQAPGKKVHLSGIPFDDASGNRLRLWLGIDRETFYDPHAVAILPMGFCYPGTGKSGDLPPRPECAPKWRATVLAQLPNIELTLVIGQYALAYHYPSVYTSLTEAVLAWRDRPSNVIVLPHPSPRNQLWVRRNPWFETELLPNLQSRIAQLLG
ncbi:uracil-DNA glycosylase family protein [Herbaspirillum chlorophenolicum]|uniref:uracil-DNA glycosylase family protein n=1 Tax=Herbaspirillum chlorophenolicum TaxID=211589 RepID=UPI00067B4FF2|nr:uracil-DNA glycosylase family protein [Herbaspirillum chlorophenolicum]